MTKRINLRLPNKLMSIINYGAKERGIPKNEYVAQAVITYNKYLHDDLNINDILVQRNNETNNIMQDGFQALGAKVDSLSTIIQALADVDHGPRYLNHDK